MILITALLVILIVWCNVTQDEIRFHWDHLFGKIIKSDSRLDLWMNPSKSWNNKYWSSNPVIRFLFCTVLVWTTDLWHFLKFILINSLFIIFLILTNEPWSWWKWLIELAVLNLVWGILFELVTGIYGAIGDWIEK